MSEDNNAGKNDKKQELKAEVKKLHDRLMAQQQEIREAKLPVVVLIEGWAAAGKGSLIYADYLIEEIGCEANAGQDLLKAYLFEEQLNEDELSVKFEDGKVIDLAEIFIDLIIHPESDLIDGLTGSKSVSFGSGVTVTDTIRYDNLKTYNDYKVKTEIFYISDEGETEYLGENTVSFKPEKIDATWTSHGTVTNSVIIDTSDLEGGYIAAVDTFYVTDSEGDDVELTVHNRDLSDERQMLFIPWIGTTAIDSLTNDHVAAASEKASVKDTVEYGGLADGKTYLIEGTLRFADTGEPVTGTDGQLCVVSRILRVSYAADGMREDPYGIFGPKDGEAVMPAFEFDAVELGGRTLVVTETLYDYDKYDEYSDNNEDAVIIEHNDLNDPDQTVYILKVVTEAADSVTDTHTGTLSETSEVTDHVTVTNAVIGQEYIIKGDLVYKADFTDKYGVGHKAGDIIASHDPVAVTAEDTVLELELKFAADSTALEGAGGVVFEEVWHNDALVAVHHDLNSDDQTVNWPKVRTTARDTDTQTHTGCAGKEEASITDTVELANLTVGDTCYVSGTLYFDTGAEFLVDGSPVTVRSELFTAEKTDMTVDMTFTFPTENLKGKRLVVFEKLICVTQEEDEETGEIIMSRTIVASHEDVTDEGQTVGYPAISTAAIDAGTKGHEGLVLEKVTMIDTVEYTGMSPGAEIIFKGILYDKETGEPLKDEEGNEFVSESRAVIPQKDGSVEVVFEVPGKTVMGKTVVVFEEALCLPSDDEGMTKEPVIVAEHKDINDEEQTVVYPQAITEGTATGDTAQPFVFCLMAAAAAIAVILLLRRLRS